MKKSDFIRKVYNSGGFKTLTEAEFAVNKIFDTVVDVLVEGDSVKITGFGTFNTKNVKEKVGRVPGKDEEYVSPAHVAPTFSFSDNVKSSVRNIKK